MVLARAVAVFWGAGATPPSPEGEAYSVPGDAAGADDGGPAQPSPKAGPERPDRLRNARLVGDLNICIGNVSETGPIAIFQALLDAKPGSLANGAPEEHRLT